MLWYAFEMSLAALLRLGQKMKLTPNPKYVCLEL